MTTFPPHGNVLYRFRPLIDNWDGTVTYSEENEGTVVEDEYDFIAHQDLPGYYMSGPGYAYKVAPNLGSINRIRCTFSITGQPLDAYEIADILSLAFDEDLETPGNEFWGYYPPQLIIKHYQSSGNYYLSFYGYLPSMGSTIISYGQEYELEMVIYNGPVFTQFVRVYLDGVLDIDWNMGGPLTYDTYAKFVAGFNSGLASQAFLGPGSTTLHIEDIIWTMEELGHTGWTMMAPGIG